MKKFYVQTNIGKAKYVVNFHQENSFHDDGSEFFDVRVFKNKRKLQKFVDQLRHSGYVEI